MDEDDPYENSKVVVVNGSGMVQCGFSFEDSPRALFPNCYGNPKNPGIMVGGDFKYDFVGDEAIAKLGILIIRRSIPIDGSPMNFKYLEKSWHQAFLNELRTYPEDHQVLMTDLPNMDSRSRKNIASLMFETFYTPAFMISNPSVLSVFANGVSTGLVLDSGYGGTRVVPVREGYPIKHAAMKMKEPNFSFSKEKYEEEGKRLDSESLVRFYDGLKSPPKEQTVRGPETLGIGGDMITQYLIKLVEERGWEMTTTAERYLMVDVKEKVCYVSLDYENDMKKVSENGDNEQIEYELPDGSKMHLGSQCFRACEVLFKPELLGWKRSRIHGVHEFIERSIQKCGSKDLKDMMYKSVILTGGNTMFPNFEERLRMELEKVTKRDDINIIAQENRIHGSWIGGKIVSSLSSFQQEVVTKEVYEEVGYTAIQRKCLRSFQFDQPEVFSRCCLDTYDTDLKERMEFVIADLPSRINSVAFVVQMNDDMKIIVPHKFMIL